MKVSSDGATSKHGEKGGGGADLRNHHGAFLAGACHHFPHIADPEAVEVLACRRAVQMAVDLQVQRSKSKLSITSCTVHLVHGIDSAFNSLSTVLLITVQEPVKSIEIKYHFGM